jgi:hypothetical protein
LAWLLLVQVLEKELLLQILQLRELVLVLQQLS